MPSDGVVLVVDLLALVLSSGWHIKAITKLFCKWTTA